MNPKKLTQAVFEGLPSEYRWAAVDADGDIVIADHGHFFWHESKKWLFPSDSTIKIIVKTIGYDASDWQNSKIERLGIPSADIDWSRQDVPEGATHWHDGGWLSNQSALIRTTSKTFQTLTLSTCTTLRGCTILPIRRYFTHLRRLHVRASVDQKIRRRTCKKRLMR